MATARKRLCFLLLPLVMITTTAAASSPVCEDIFRQLSRSRTETIGANEDTRYYAGAIARQNIVARRLKNNLRQAGCSSGSIVIYGGRNNDMCADISDRLDAVEADIRDLQELRNNAMRNEPDRSERQMLLAALSANGCDEELPVPVSVSPQQYEPEPRPETEGSIIRFPAPAGSVQEGGLRTLCVRTCDGAFFPISSNASPLDFSRQADQCSRMCPGAETELYYHSLTDQESADMVSTQTGRPYRELPTAFAYRSTGRASNPQCGCNMSAYQREVKREDNNSTKPADAYSGITRITPPDSAKPQVEATAPPPPERDYNPQESNVRVVGPQFLPSENSHIDLDSPAVTGAQPLQ